MDIKMKKNILIGGVFYGHHNIGDEAILKSMLNSFSNQYNVSVMTDGSEWVNKFFPDVKKIKIKDRFEKPKYGIPYSRKPVSSLPSKIIKTLFPDLSIYKNMDAYICGGATILSDCPWYSIRTIQLAERSHVPVYLWGVGMAEVKDKETLNYIASILNKDNVKMIFTRDDAVKKRLGNIGINTGKIKVCYDPAIMTNEVNFSLTKYLSKKQIDLYNTNRKKIILSISGEKDVVNRTPIETIIKAMKIIQEKYNAIIFMIPTGCGVHCKDLFILKEIERKVNSDNFSVIEQEFMPEELVFFLKKCDLIISSRLHMNIFGVCASVCSIGLVRNSKISDFAKLMEMPYLSLDNMNYEDLVEKADIILQNKEKLQNQLIHKRESLREIYKKAVICLTDDIK